MPKLRHIAGFGSLVTLLAFQSPASAQPTVRQALGLSPMQDNVEYDIPQEADIDSCTIQPERSGEARAWIVADSTGNLLRRFTDTNADNKIDLWCYFRGGVEVYRDIDADYNEKADQYRWFGIGGLRWGLDSDEDGSIDDWKWISPEEVTSELISAIGTQNSARFNALLATKNELEKSGLSPELIEQLTAQIEKAKADFAVFAKQQTRITPNSTWVDFSAPQPGVIPGGSQQTQQDLIVYENVIAMLETGGKHDELPVGTLIRVDNRWRLLGLPGRDEGGFFFRVADRRTLPVASIADPNNPKTQQLVQRLEDLDKQLAAATSPTATNEVYSERAGVLRDLVAASTGEERDMWLLQLIDSVVATAQPGGAGNPVEILGALSKEIEQSTENKEIIAQAKFAYLTTEYTDSLQQPSADLAKIQEKWITDLTEFAEKFSGAKATGEAMLQLAISKEFAGEDQEAGKWYASIVKDHAGTDMAEKASGAVRRLGSIGKPLQIQGTGIQGSPVDSSALRGNLVVVQYWATWCEPCKQDMSALRDLLGRYGKKKVAVLGINLDDNPRGALAYLQQNKMTWPQLHEPGGLESDQAKQMGIFTLPIMLLLDEQGKVINRSLTIPELENELKKRRK